MSKSASVKARVKEPTTKATLDDAQQLAALLRAMPDIFIRQPSLLADIELAHQSGAAVSLIERQVEVLRERNRQLDARLQGLMDVARANERLAESRHRIAVNLLGARDLDDVLSTVHDELGNELKADFVVVRLISDEPGRLEQRADLFVPANTPGLRAFKTLREQKNPLCGAGSDEQKQFLFAAQAEDIASMAVIPLYAGADLGLIGLGSRDGKRFQAGMATDFLAQTGELVSAALAVHLEADRD